jgi:RNA polymerase sigma factor (sigma-70 family)
LDIALERLRELDPREASIVELRLFAGLTVPEIASALGVSIATVERDWVSARAWLRRELTAESSLA